MFPLENNKITQRQNLIHESPVFSGLLFFNDTTASKIQS